MCIPLLPIAFPFKFSYYKVHFSFINPSNNVFTPYPRSSFNSKFNLFIFMFILKYFFNVGPIDDFMKFFPISNDTKCIALLSKYYAPCVLIKFYDIFSYLIVLFLFNGIDII